MCGRYKVSTPGDELWETFDLHGEQLPLVPRWNVAPSQPIALIREPHQLELLRWGLSLANTKASGINVRVESLSAPMYRESIRQRRCLIIADGFYEWKAIAGAKSKQPYLLQRRDRRPFAFAGIWADSPSEARKQPGAAILTTTALGVAREVHDRMPVILSPDARGRWLDPQARYRDLLEPDYGELELVRVGPFVNKPANDSPECAEPVGAEGA